MKIKLSVLITSVLVTSIVVFGILTLYIWIVDYNYFMSGQSYNQMAIMNDNVNHNFVAFLKIPRENHEVFSHLVLEEKVQDSQSILDLKGFLFEFLLAMRSEYPQVTGVGFADEENHYIRLVYNERHSDYHMTLQSEETGMHYVSFKGAATDREILSEDTTVNVRYRAGYMPFLVGESPEWANLSIIDSSQSEAAVSSLYPIYDDEGLVGVSALDINLSGLNDFLISEALKYNSIIMLFNERNELIATSIEGLENIVSDEEHPEGRLKKFSEYENPLLSSVGEIIVSNDVKGLDDFKVIVEGETYLVKFHQLQDDVGLNWYSVILKNENVIISSMRERWQRNLLIMLSASVLILVLGLFFVGRIGRYLSRLRDFALSLINGNYGRVPQVEDIFISELSEFNHAFNYLLSDLMENLNKLEESKENYRLIFETSYEGIWHYDLRNDRLDISDKWFRKLGYSGEQTAGGRGFLASVILEEDRHKTIFTIDGRDADIDDVISEEFRIRGNDGAVYWVFSKGRVTKRSEGSKPMEMTGGFVEITERKMMERNLADALALADKASRAKTDFLANMSHEIRTPMNAIIGYSELLGGTELSGDQPLYLENLRLASSSLLDILNDILDLSRIEENKLQLESIDFDLKQLLRKVSSIIGIKGKSNDVRFSMDVEGSISRLYIGDPLRLQQILINLLSNALKFTHKGQVRLLTTVSETAHSVDCSFTVEDTGIGIEPDQLASLFEKFAQADSSTTREYGGSGLGLSIVKELAELMDGELTADSTVGVGSRFTIKLTFGISDKPVPVEAFPEVKKQQQVLNFTDKSVLVVEDNEFNMDIICRLLERMKITVTRAYNGKEAVELCEQESFDLVLMDFQMPVMDGVEATSQIRLTLDMQQLPIVALTAHSMRYDHNAVDEMGFNGLMVKPLDVKELYSILRRYLGGSTPEQSDKSLVQKDVVDSTDGDDKAIVAFLGDHYMAVKIRMDGDWPYYKRLLGDFIAKYGDAQSMIRDLADKGSFEALAKYAHAIVGVAGNLGLGHLSGLMKLLEHDSLDQRQIDPTLIVSLTEELKRVCTVGNALNLDDKPLGVQLETDRLKELFDELESQLRRKVFKAVETYEQIEEGLKLRADQEDIINLGRCVNDFRFEEALVVMKEMRIRIEEA